MKQKSFCTSCKKKVSNKTKKCKCGGHNFAFGDLIVKDNQILCKCGNAEFKRGMHMDFTDKATTTFICIKCGNVCGTEYYRDAEDMMNWV